MRSDDQHPPPRRPGLLSQAPGPGSADRPLPRGSGLRPAGSLTLIIPEAVANHSSLNLVSCRPRTLLLHTPNPSLAQPRTRTRTASCPPTGAVGPAPCAARSYESTSPLWQAWPDPSPEGYTLLLERWGVRAACELLGNPEAPGLGSTWVVGCRIQRRWTPKLASLSFSILWRSSPCSHYKLERVKPLTPVPVRQPVLVRDLAFSRLTCFHFIFAPFLEPQPQ